MVFLAVTIALSIGICLPAPVQAASVSTSSFTGTVTAPSFGNYSGMRIYLSARNQWDETVAGTSIVCPGPGRSVPYTINGINPGGYYSPYMLEAFVDRLGTAYRHLSDPSTPQLAYYAYSGANTANLNIIAYSPPHPAAPAAPTVVAGDRAVLLSWDSQRNTAGVEIPDAFRVGWTTDPSFSTGVTYSPELPANGNNNYIVQGLTNGTSYYFAVEAIVYADTSTTWISPTGGIRSATPAVAGGNGTVGGTLVTPPPGALSRPAYVVLLDPVTGHPVSFFASSTAPNPIPFALAGVPDGQYRLLALIDQNNSNRLDQGDIHLPPWRTLPVTVAGGTATCSAGCTIDLTGYQNGSQANLTTLNWSDLYNGSQGYQLNFALHGMQKIPASAAISGPQLTSGGNIAIVQEGGNGVSGSFAVPLAPAVSDAYSVLVTYTDGTSETIPVAISGFVAGLPANLAPANTLYLAALPTFTWALPGTGTNTVDFHISSMYSQFSIDVTGLAPNTLSYNLATRAGTILANDTYAWSVVSVDSNGNSAETRTRLSYYLDNTPPTVSASPAGGSYSSARYVTLSASDSGSSVDKIWYTTDGSDPTVPSGTRQAFNYYTPLLVKTTTDVKFYAVDSVGNASAVVTASYVIADTAPPAVQPSTVLPASNSTLVAGSCPTISVEFSELIEHTAIGTAGFSVTKDGVPLSNLYVSFSDSTYQNTTGVTLSDTGTCGLVSGTYTVTIPGTLKDLAGNAMGSDYTWTFSVNESFQVSTTSGSSGSGSFTCNSVSCLSSYPAGTQVSILATPSAGSVFSGWSGACTGTTNPCTMTVVPSTSISGRFDTYVNVSATSSTGNSGTMTCNGGSCTTGLTYGATVAVKAIPGNGSLLAGWGGACSGTTGDTCSYVADGTPAYAGFVNNNTLGGVPNEGNLSITLENDGRIGIRRFSSGAWINQVYSWNNKGSMLHSSSDSINLGYFGGSTIPIFDQSRSGMNSDRTSHVSVWTTPALTVTQTVTYQPADQYYRLQWDILNSGPAELVDLRFFHGQDSYFDGNDRGGGFWDNFNNTVGVQRTYSSSLRRMYLQGVTQPFAYESQYYSSVSSHGEAFALTDAIDPAEGTDNGYALEWRLGSGDPPYKNLTGWTGANLAPGATWTILASEKFSDIAITGGVSVNAPVTASCAAGVPCNLNFRVTNTGNTIQTISLAASSDQAGWTPSPGSNSITFAAGLSQQVNVIFIVPASGASAGHVTLTANRTSSDTAAVTVTTTTFAVNAIAGTGGSIAPASADVALNGTTTFTIAADSGHAIGSVSGCGGTLTGSTYTTGTITAACTVNATFTRSNQTGIAYSGAIVDQSGFALPGATIAMVGNHSLTTLSDANGTFSLAGLPTESPFTLEISLSGYLPTYTHSFRSTSDVIALFPYVLYTPADAAGWGIMAGKGAIRSRVVDSSNQTTGYLGGVVITATSQNHPGTPYEVVYYDGTSYGGSATYDNGIFMVRNVEEGDTVTVIAAKLGWNNASRTFLTHGDAVSDGRIVLTPTSGTISIATTELSPGIYGSPWNRQLQATGGTGAYVWSVSSGSLPPGVNLTSDGAISGIPTRAGSYSFTVQVADSAAASQSATRAFTVDIARGVPVVTWPAPITIAYGTALSGTQLNATADIPGTFAYTPAAGTVPKPGNQSLSVTFTPTDNVNYSSRTVAVTLAVTSPTGDIDGNGTVDIVDALLALQIAVGMKPATAAQLLAGDVAPLENGIPAPNGTINVGDALVILQKVVGSYSW
ncbi:hypothetical protein GSVR_37750 [Geobacter sp. SVR]|nr:hypothetical protein GSVR_37750 [Geobacter sp. SVR]